ncbi:MAG TPA: AI-2E family transporter [Dissulfurispiraceae bacterium]|nr:AI-2E family transporter [Dissulfurispiraceae bacterium]
MTNNSLLQPSDRTSLEKASFVLTASALTAILYFHLLPALLGGLLVHELIHVVAQRLKIGQMSGRRAKLIATAMLATAAILLVGVSIWATAAHLHGGADSLPALLKKLAEIIEDSKSLLPAWMTQALPQDAEGGREWIADWLRNHASEIQSVGKEAGKLSVHLFIGMIIGALIALQETRKVADLAPLGSALAERAVRLARAFRLIAFAQIRISLINTIFTSIYLLIVLPIFGLTLPLAKTLVLVTFLAGLLPVIGNLISNTMIVLVSLSVSLPVAAASLVFLVVIHKLEYFLNARIVGSQIAAHAWELLIAMLVLESIFGMRGLIAAPIYYAYLKTELTDSGLV